MTTSPLRFYFIYEADFRCSQAATMANRLPTAVRHLTITEQCRNTRCAVVGLLSKGWYDGCSTSVKYTLSVGLSRAREATGFKTASHDLNFSKRWTAQCYASKCDWSKYLITLRIERDYTGLLFLSFSRFFF
jgi:hypothetical protein